MTAFWWEEDPPAWSLPLELAALAYRAGAALHRALSRPARAGAPVISIGNLTVGGAGKTPVALALAVRLRARGRKPAVLSRGYGRRSREPLRVAPDASARDCGDEPLLLARRGLTVFVGPRRAALAKLAVEQGADVLLLDDGLQHHALARDLDVVGVDASNPFGNGRLLPRGPLREPVSALRRVPRGLLWLTRCDLPRSPRLSGLPGWPTVESAFEPTGAAGLRGARVFLFAGIARPASFEATVRGLGAEIAGARWFRDHHFFRAGEISALQREAQHAGAGALATTEKDFVRIDAGLAAGIVPVPVELRISSGGQALDAALAEVL
jgi:tetraacyldisaccharide 4'-kinase